MKTTKTNAFRPNSNFVIFSVMTLISSAVVGCVTVNVNFPESAVQKASDDYVRDIYRSKEQSRAPKASPSPSTSTSSFIHFEGLISTAYASESSLKLDSPKMDQIKDKMRARVPEIITQKKEGVVGESNDALLVIRDADKVKPLLKKKVETLVKEENIDRENLYSEIVHANNLSSNNLPQVKRSFTRSFQAESPSGTWVQAQDGTWSQKL